MSVINEDKFNAILAMAKRAKTDNEKFAAMLIIARSCTPDTMSKAQFCLVLDSIGLCFPCRLLATACQQATDQEVRKAYGTISASVIKLFCIHNHGHLEMKGEQTVPLLLKAIEAFTDFTGCEDVIDDCLEAMTSLVEHKLAVECNYLAIFHLVTSSPCPVPSRLRSILVLVLRNYPQISQTDSFNEWIIKISLTFKITNGAQKFDICKTLCLVFQNLHENFCFQLGEWLKNVIIGLGDILCSRVTQDQKHTAIVLASELLSKYGLKPFTQLSHEKNFIVLVTRLACIEVSLFFEDVRCQKDEKLSTILSCFKITEIFCDAIAQFEQNEEGVVGDCLNFEQISLVLPALSEVVEALKEYISLMLSQGVAMTQKALLHSCIRMFGCWLNIEYNLSSNQGIEAFRTVPTILKYVWSIRDFYMIKFVLPAVMVAVDTDFDIPNVSTIHDIFGTLCDMLKDLFRLKKVYNSFGEEATVIKLAMQCVISLCQSRPDTIIKINYESIHSLVCVINDFVGGTDVDLTVEAYICTMVAICLNICPIIRSECDNLFKKCLGFLFGAFKMDAVSGKLELNDEYQDFWPEASPLWQATCREVVKYCNNYSLGRKLYKSTAWPSVLQRFSHAVGTSHDIPVSALLELADLE